MNTALQQNPVLSDDVVVDVSTEQLQKLRTLNIIMGTLHAVSGILMIVLGNDFRLTTTTFGLNGPPGTPIEDGTLSSSFSFLLAPATAAFLLLSAFFHFLIASPFGFGKYAAELRRGRNRFRWVEYSLSSTLMILLIAVITNITDVAALVALAFANLSMILFGWIMEMVNEPDRKVWWTPFWFGCIAGIGPWLAIVVSLVVSLNVEGAQGPPGFVYGIIFSLFFFFNTFAINQYLQYKQVGKWKDYLVGERTYIVLSLVAKSILAWQIFANTLIG